MSRLLGDTDSEGNIHGEAEIFYDNGDYVWADFCHGVKVDLYVHIQIDVTGSVSRNSVHKIKVIKNNR